MIGGISPISGYVGFQAYVSPYQRTTPYRAAEEGKLPSVSGVEKPGTVTGIDPITGEKQKASSKVDKITGKEECQTCKERKYQDGSDENVSFKSPQKIAPGAAAAMIRGHEQEHVANAYEKVAGKKDAKVLQASVTMKMAICPECGKPYFAGGETNTTIKYKEESPYGKNQKSSQYEASSGKNVDLAV